MKLLLTAGLLSAIFVGRSMPPNILAREQWSSTRTFKWKVATTVYFGKSALQELEHASPEVREQLQRSGRFNLRKRQTEAILVIKRGSEVDVIEYEITHSTDFPNRKYRFVCAKDYLAIPGQHDSISNSGAPPMTAGVASILPTKEKALYIGVPTLLAGIDEVAAFHPAFHAGANPTKVKVPFGWTGSIQTLWVPDSQGPERFFLRIQGAAIGTLQLSRQHGYAPSRLEIHQGHIRHLWETLRWRKFGEHWFPCVVVYQYSDRVVNHQARFELISIETSSTETVPLFSLGETVMDYRLCDLVIDAPQRSRENIVSYIWQGRLPTEEELKQLAYQQGNLIPPDMPRRRFSLLLFVPAIIFFALAAYLYFRNRRR